MRITIYGPVVAHDGYGNIVIGLTQALHSLGHTVSVVPSRYKPAEVSPLVLSRVGSALSDSVGLWVATPSHVNLRHRHTACYSMYEFPQVPSGWPLALNHYHLNLVPCQWVREVWVNSGVTTPIDVIPLGFDPSLWRTLERSQTQPWTFLTFGTLQARKAPVMAAEAFLEAFPVEDVRLILKSGSTMPVEVYSDDSRIRVINEDWDQASLLALCEESDCFVYPTRGEGFGLPPLEATATGMPVLMPACTAGLDRLYLTYEVPLMGAETMVNLLGNQGSHPVPSYRGLIRQMRHVYEHPEEAREVGREASRTVHSTLTWEHCARRMVEALRAKFPTAP